MDLASRENPRVGTSRYFPALTAQQELLCQNDEKISPSFSPYGFYENPVSTTGSLQLQFRISKFLSGFKTAFDVERYLFWVLST